MFWTNGFLSHAAVRISKPTWKLIIRYTLIRRQTFLEPPQRRSLPHVVHVLRPIFFWRFRVALKNILASSCPCVRAYYHGRISVKFCVGDFMKIRRKIPDLVKIWQIFRTLCWKTMTFSLSVHSERIVAFPLQTGYANAPQWYVVRTLPVLSCRLWEEDRQNSFENRVLSRTCLYVGESNRRLKKTA